MPNTGTAWHALLTSADPARFAAVAAAAALRRTARCPCCGSSCAFSRRPAQ